MDTRSTAYQATQAAEIAYREAQTRYCEARRLAAYFLALGLANGVNTGTVSYLMALQTADNRHMQLLSAERAYIAAVQEEARHHD